MEAAQAPRMSSAEDQRQQVAPTGYFFKQNLYLSVENRYDNLFETIQIIKTRQKEIGDDLFVTTAAFSDEGLPLAADEAVALYTKVEPRPVKRARLLGSAGVGLQKMSHF